MKTEYPVEAYTTTFEYLKHLATLSTGSTLLLVTFLDKLFVNPEWKVCIAVSLISFVLTVIFTIAAQAGVIESITEPEDIAKWAKPLIGVSLTGALLFFITGLVSLVAFSLVNFN